jgi:hypothetical protein
MNPISKIFQPIDIAKLAIFLCSSLLVSCGGSVNLAGIGGTGITSGEITQFGSVHMNGVIFETTNSEFEVDGDIYPDQFEAIRDGELSVGMVAKVYGTTDGNGLTGTADLVVYDDDIEGPVSNLGIQNGTTKTFEIFGQTIVIDEFDTFFDGTDFHTLSEDDIIEVSGLHASATKIHATYVKFREILMDGSELELKGDISSHDSEFDNFILGGVLIDYSTIPPEDIDVTGDVLYDGLYVEVHGTYNEPDSSITAVEIEEEDEEFGDDIEHISLEGIIADFSNTPTIRFTINSQPVDASGAVFFDSDENPFIPSGELSNGVRVEVEGTISGGVLYADEVELH